MAQGVRVSKRELLERVYRTAAVTDSGSHVTTVNELTDQLPALEMETLIAARETIREAGPFDADKIAVEEDKGLPIGVAVALKEGLPLAVARWYTYDIDVADELRAIVDIDSEYFTGTLYLNGVEAGDRVVIVDDTISTGGTMVAMIEAIREAGAEVVGAHCITEKVDKGGVERVERETGVEVTTSISISANEDGVDVVD
jgi:adenine phosphoribosyltransferase